MRIKKEEVVQANVNNLKHWLPKPPNISDERYKGIAKDRIDVYPPGTDDEKIEVVFHTNLVWAITDDSPDAQEFLKWVGSLFPGLGATASPGEIALNGVNTL